MANIFTKALDNLGWYLTGITQNRKWKFNAVSLNMVRGWFSSQTQVQKYGLKKPWRVTFKTLRQIAQRDAIIRICINVIKKSVSQCEWDIAIKKNAPGKIDKDYEEERMKIFELFDNMDMNGENLRTLLDRLLEDILCLDAWVLEIIRSMDGKEIVALNCIDAATIRPVYNAYGELGSPAYYQLLNEAKVAEFEKEDLVYMMMNPQNDVDFYWYGMSNIEAIMLQVQAALEADMFNIKKFSKDNTPPGILDLWDMTQDQAEEFIATWNATVVGNPHSMKFVRGSNQEKKFIPFQGTNKDMQYVEYINWLSKLKLAAYGLSGMDANILQDMNRSNWEVMAEISSSRGVASAKKLIEEYFTRNIIRQMDKDNDKYKRLEFKFQSITALDGLLKRAQTDDLYVGMWALTVDEIRARDGLPVLKKQNLSDALNTRIRSDLWKNPVPKIDGRWKNNKPKQNLVRWPYNLWTGVDLKNKK